MQTAGILFPRRSIRDTQSKWRVGAGPVTAEAVHRVSGYMNTAFGKLWKHWPHEIAKDDRILLRVDDAIYERRLVRIMEGAIVAPVIAQLAEKYFDGASFGDPDEAVRNGDMWLYEVAPRS